MVNPIENPNAKALEDANLQLQSLGRVSHKLAMVDAEKLQTVLDKLLPRLLHRIGDNNRALMNAKDRELKTSLSKIHTKLVEMFSHIMSRVRDDKNCRLTNTRGILDVLLTTDDENNGERVLKNCDSFSLNLSLAFLTLAIPRSTLSELDDILPDLMILYTCYERRMRSLANDLPSTSDSMAIESTRKQWHQVSHLLLRTLERLIAEEEESLDARNNNKRIKTTGSNSSQGGSFSTGLDKARILLSRQEQENNGHSISIADATYELLLDALMYQTQVGNVPPPGMSSAGWDRLKSGHSVLERDWAAEMAPPNRLATFKNRILEWVAPNRRFCLFMGNAKNFGEAKNEEGSEERNFGTGASTLMLGRSRTVALLVTASGDPMKLVSDLAKQYLKQYYDTQRETGGFGNANVLTKELLALCVGGINAESVLQTSATFNDTAAKSCGTLGILYGGFSFRRRQVSDTHFAENMTTAKKALNDIIYDDQNDIDAIGNLSVLASDKMLSKLRNTHGLTMLRGKPYLAAAQLLNQFIVQLDKHRRQLPEDLSVSTKDFALEARTLNLTVNILSPIAASRMSSSSNTQISEANVAVRDSIYGTISILCRSQFAKDRFLCLAAAGDTETTVLSTDLLQLLFRCVGNEIDKLRPRATAALDALLYACRRVVVEERQKGREGQCHQKNPWGGNASDTNSATVGANAIHSETIKSPVGIAQQLGKSILPILWTSSHRSQPRQSHIAAARWSSELLLDLDVVNGTHILSFLAGDNDVTASAIAKEGLGLQDSKSSAIADFDELIRVLISDDDQIETETSLPTFWDFSPSGKAVAIKCLLRSYLDDFNGGESGLRSLIAVLTKCLGSTETNKNEDVIDACSEAFSVCVSQTVGRKVVLFECPNFGLNDLMNIIVTTSSAKSKRFLADAFGNLLMDTTLFDSKWTEIINGALAFASNILELEPLKPSNGVQGAALLGGTCVRLTRLHSALIGDETYGMASKLVKRLGGALSNADDMIGNIFCDAIFLSFSDGLALELHNGLKLGVVSVLENITRALNKFGHGDHVNAPRILKLLEPAGLSISISSGLSERSDCVKALFRLLGSDAFRKDEEIGLAIGEALALFADSCNTTEIKCTESDVENWPLDLNETFGMSLSPPSQVVYTLLRTARSTSNNHKRRACAPALLAVIARATRHEHTNLRICLQQSLHEIQDCFLFLLVDSKSSQLSRESCCLGLAACNKIVVNSEVDELQGRLLRSFGSTTNHGGSAMQETAEQAAQRRRADGANDTSAPTDTPGTDVGGAAGVSEAALGAYREMASAAVASGRPDILYSMLIISVSHSIWFATEKRLDAYGPSSLQGENFKDGEVKEALRPFLSKLLPRILRASYDPNKRTREQMKTLWVGLTGGGEEGRKAISDNFRPTMDTLVEDTSSKFWRARVGACGALSQICVGRSWADLGGGPAVLDENYDLVVSKTSSDSTLGGIRLLRLWRAVIRSLDDVRITVREAGESLGRSVRGLTIFLCNPYIEDSNGTLQHSEERERDAISASATALRWLLRNGLKQQCAEAAGICISALIGIIDIAKPAILEALLSDVIYALLMAMSNLEPAAFSYLAIREEVGSEDYENLARLRIQASQSSPLATAVRKCIDLVPKSRNLNYQEAVVPALESAIRKSSGMATRTAAAECVITLCTTSPHIFKSSSSSSLLRCFFDAVYRERGGKAAQDKMNSAFGSLSALCPGTVVRPLASLAADRYKEAHGNNDDATMRHASALILRSIAVKASNQYSDPGNSDIWCRKVLPISFLGMRDPAKSTASLWREVWEDGGSAIDLGSSDSGTGNTLEEQLLLSLTKECVRALEDISWSRRVTGAAALHSLAEKEILAPPPRRLNGKYSSLEQARARKRAHASRIALSSLVRLLSRNRIWTGKHEVVRATVQLCKAWIPFSTNPEAEAFLGEPNQAPIIIGDPSSENDLFLSDAFFSTVTENDEVEEESDNDDGILQSERIATDSVPSLLVSGICRLLLNQSFPQKSATRSVADEEILPYRSNVLKSLEVLLKSLPDTFSASYFRGRIFSFLSPKLWGVFRRDITEQPSSKESPLIVARCIDCFASSCWSRMEFQVIEQASTISSSALLQTFLFHVDFTKQSAWTVREAATKGASKLVQCADFDTLQRRHAVSTLVDIARIASKDRRFWKVRLGGLGILLSLVMCVRDSPHADTDEKKQMALEIILPFKESIQDLAKKSLNDSEAMVTAESTKILGITSTWP